MIASCRTIAGWLAFVVIGSGGLVNARVHWKLAETDVRDVGKTSGGPGERSDAEHLFQLGVRYYYGRGVLQDYAEAARWYRKAAELGNAKAQFNLSTMLHDGKGVQQDHAGAVRWCRKAADQGDQKAQAALGYAYYNGQGVPREYSEAAAWYRKAADQGYSLAEQSLGYMYANGEGVPQDYAQAVTWYRKAAEQGDAVSQQSLGYMYATGRGVRRDQNEAVRWFTKAAAQGDTNAKRALDSLDQESRPPMKTRYIELSVALVAFSVGLWLSADFLRQGKRPLDRRQLAITLLGVSFLINAGMSFYAFFHDIRFSPHENAFHLARRVLVGLAILIVVTVFFSPKKTIN